ncbi:MAG: 16S rRNA (cytidine(1402)-2'-O)-methyltransferase [Puniceicoccales bacterium]|nr:16S rRNA (cytidine(1402)-2'-O)-methyltransferase [Puniceicoccales bacterium]
MIADGKLFVISTPIGNLSDITLRAIDTLKTCDLVACEDTRNTKILLNYFKIEAKLISYHEYNEISRAREIVALIKDGRKIGLVCDAGTPTISDPGFRVVRECRKNDIEVIPIPGVSAFLAALSVAGLPSNAFLFIGFLPAKSVGRIKVLDRHKYSDVTIICYESCHRISKSLDDMLCIFGPERVISISKEITKLHEFTFVGSIPEAVKWVVNDQKGEFVIVIAPKDYSL